MTDTPSRPLRVLVVEDKADTRRSLCTLLCLWGHETATAADGDAALEAATRLCPDVILLDIGLPRLDGWEVARRIRQVPGMGDVRLVALTGYGAPADRARSQEVGVDQHLVKPVDLNELQAALVGARA
jgi:CheY-like chemotaxis protein